MLNEYLIKESKSSQICFGCSKKETKFILLNSNQIDFFYICLSHLLDITFAKPVITTITTTTTPITTTTTPTQSDIDKVIKDYNLKNNISSSWLSTISSAATSISNAAISSITTTTTTTTIPTPLLNVNPTTLADLGSNRQYILHRDIFNIRLRKYKKGKSAINSTTSQPNRQGAWPDLPSVPKGGFT